MKEAIDKIAEVQKILPRRIYSIEAAKNDLIENLKNKAMVEIIRTAIVLYGYGNYVEIVN